MGGEEDSEAFDYFKVLCMRGFLEARKHMEKFCSLVSIMTQGPPMPCWGGVSRDRAEVGIVEPLRQRFFPDADEGQVVEHVYQLIEESIDNWRTWNYDLFQSIVVGIKA
eukprot:GABV01006240.1.p1 GENE.GABV01006240.1~~GABV01006240.1.p1  ORF type:complete len:109 (+),score=16.57 GABV01006240.1:72-398(+)